MKNIFTDDTKRTFWATNFVSAFFFTLFLLCFVPSCVQCNRRHGACIMASFPTRSYEKAIGIVERVHWTTNNGFNGILLSCFYCKA